MSTPLPPSQSSHSPFLILPDVLSPLNCEAVIGEVAFDLPTYDPITNGAVKTVKMNEMASAFLEDHVFDQATLAAIYDHFGVVVEDIPSTEFEWFPTKCASAPAAPETHKLMSGQWTKTRQADLIAVLFLMNHHDGKPGALDVDFEVLGGKLEFPSFKFGLKPQMGTMVVYPAAPNFANATTSPQLGEMFQVRFFLQGSSHYAYDPRNFSGNYTTWFR